MGILNSTTIRDVRLEEFPTLAQGLCRRVEDGGFSPDCVVYLEQGARLLAGEACRHFKVCGVPLTIQRQGMGLKQRLARPLALLPRAIKDSLRRIEAALLWKQMSSNRVMRAFPTVNLRGKRVLIVDDAVDTGTSVRMAREWALSMGASLEMVKVAALSVTTRLADGLVDYSLYRVICRFPWSSDSEELDTYREVYRKTCVPQYEAEGVVMAAGAK